jgi:hypothetical protein
MAVFRIYAAWYRIPVQLCVSDCHHFVPLDAVGCIGTGEDRRLVTQTLDGET